MSGGTSSISRRDRDDICEITCINPDAVARVRRKLIDADTATELAGLFRVLGDPTRLRIVSLLDVSELCVCDMAAALNMTQSAVSHQLRVLRMLKLVKFRKEGRIAYYSLDDEHVHKLFLQGIDHLAHRSSGTEAD